MPVFGNLLRRCEVPVTKCVNEGVRSSEGVRYFL
jgi:hypothetical protein